MLGDAFCGWLCRLQKSVKEELEVGACTNCIQKMVALPSADSCWSCESSNFCREVSLRVDRNTSAESTCYSVYLDLMIIFLVSL